MSNALNSIKVNPKGQVTISADARKQLGIKPEMRLLEVVVNNCLLLIPQDEVITDILYRARTGMKQAGLSAKRLKIAINSRRSKNLYKRYPALT